MRPTGEPITLYGDGKQVRDVLFVDDLVDAFLPAEQRLPDIAGQAFNIGGGPENTLSLLELIDRIAALNGRRPRSASGLGGSATSAGMSSTSENFTGRPAGGRGSASRRACAGCMPG